MKIRQTLVLFPALAFIGLGAIGCAQDIVETPPEQ